MNKNKKQFIRSRLNSIALELVREEIKKKQIKKAEHEKQARLAGERAVDAPLHPKFKRTTH